VHEAKVAPERRVVRIVRVASHRTNYVRHLRLPDPDAALGWLASFTARRQAQSWGDPSGGDGTFCAPPAVDRFAPG